MNHTAPWSGNPSFPRECARAGGNFRNRSIDGFSRLVVNNNESNLQKYAAKSPGRYDLTTTEGRQEASAAMAQGALNIYTELTPEQRFRIEATKLLWPYFGRATPALGDATASAKRAYQPAGDPLNGTETL